MYISSISWHYWKGGTSILPPGSQQHLLELNSSKVTEISIFETIGQRETFVRFTAGLDVTNAQVQAHGKTLLREAKKGRHIAWTNKCFCVADGTQTTHKLFCVWLRKIAKHTQREIYSNWNRESAIHRPEIKYAFILHVSRQIWVNILSSTSYFSSKNVKRKTKVSPSLNFWYFFLMKQVPWPLDIEIYSNLNEKDSKTVHT